MPPDRHVLISARSPRPEQVPAGARALTPGPRAAAALGVPHRSLRSEALRDVLGSGRRVATPLRRWRALGAAVERALPELEAGPWRRALAGPVRELLRAGALETPEPHGLSLASSRALAVARVYRDMLANDDAIDPAELFRVAAERATGVRDEPWAVIGLPRLDRAATRYLDAVAAPGSRLLLPPEGEAVARRLAAAGWRVARDDAPLERPGDRWARRFLDGRGAGTDDDAPPTATAFASQDEELRWMLARVARLRAEGVPADEILLVARDPVASAPRLDALAWELSLPLRVAHELPLAATPAGGFVAALAEVVARRAPFEETLRLLRHRLAGGLAGDALDRARRVRPEGPDAWARLDPRAGALDWPERDARAAFGRRFEATLQALDLPRDDLDPHDRLVLELALRGAAEACEPAGREVSRRAFLDDLTELLSLLRVPAAPAVPDAGGGVVEVTGPAGAAGAAVDHLFVLGAVEGELPADVRDDPILDFADRARLSEAGADLDGARERARAEEAEFAQLLRAARSRARIGVPARAGGTAVLPSPYLARLGATPSAAPPRPPASPEERRRERLQSGGDDSDPVLAAARHAWRVEARREGAEPPDAFDGVTGRPRDASAWTFSATSLVDIGQCPFRFFGRYLLGLREPDEADEVVPPRLRGVLWHAALERGVRDALSGLQRDATLDGRGRPGAGDPGGALRAATLDALPAAFAAAEREAEVPDTPAWRRVRGGELRALERLVRSEDFVGAGLVPVELERRFRGVWRGLRVSGVVDRVDAGADGVELIDYKSGASRPKGARRAAGRGWIDVQLPLYLEVAAPEVAPHARPLGARYLSVRAAATVATVEPDADAEALDELASRVVDLLAAGTYPVAPDDRREVCRLCDLASVCRVGPRVDRKRDAAEAGAAKAGARDGATSAGTP
jgi:RecB family exonuclease